MATNQTKSQHTSRVTPSEYSAKAKNISEASHQLAQNWDPGEQGPSRTPKKAKKSGGRCCQAALKVQKRKKLSQRLKIPLKPGHRARGREWGLPRKPKVEGKNPRTNTTQVYQPRKWPDLPINKKLAQEYPVKQGSQSRHKSGGI